jgi:heat shock protein HtpX
MSSRSTLGRDRGLEARMALTLFLLGAVYVILVVALLAAGAGVVMVALIGGALFAAQLLLSDKLALRAMGARVTTPEQAPSLHALVERLCVQADLPKPRIAVAETSVPNAFALGRSPRNATVCATTGLLELLPERELEGVLAHELAHVQHRDVAVMTVASFFASLAAFVLQFGFLFGGGDQRNNPAWPVVLGVSLAVYAISFFLMRALSRHREFAADRGAAQLTGRPSALASALLRISGQMKAIPQRDLRAASELSAFFIIPAVPRQSLTGLLSTHPPIEKRIEALRRVEEELQSAGRGPARPYRELTDSLG